MKKVFIVHGFMSAPNAGFRPWLMSELNKLDVYACALPMPNPNEPICDEWIKEIVRAIPEPNEDIFLVGHSLGSTAILNYLETVNSDKKFGGVFLVSGPVEKLRIDDLNAKIRKIDNFLNHPFDFKKIKDTAEKFIIIHGDNDEKVPFSHAEEISKGLEGELVMVKGGGHLSGRDGFDSLPILLEKFVKLTNS